MEQAQGKTYTQLMSMISELEPSAAEQKQTTYVDLLGTFNQRDMQTVPLGYASTMSKLSVFDKDETLQKGVTQAQRGTPADQIKPNTAIGMMQVGPYIPEREAQAVAAIPQEGHKDIGKYAKHDIDSAKKELGNLLNALKGYTELAEKGIMSKSKQQKQAAVVMPQANPPDISVTAKEDAILPSLPIVEQISELEKIEEGLLAGVFGKEHIIVIRSEINALKRAKSAGQGTELAALRDIKLSEVDALLK